MKWKVRFSPGKALSIGFTILAALAVTSGSSQASSCTPPPPGLVAWWPGEGNANDVIGPNNGFVTNGVITYDAGEVGLAFHYNGAGGYVQVPASSSLNVGLGVGFTVEGWISPADLINPLPLIEWQYDGVTDRPHFWTSSGGGAGSLYANLIDTSGNPHSFNSSGGILTVGYQHVALTYDKTTIGQAYIYRNGVAVANANLGVFTPRTGNNLLVGARTYLGGALQFNYVGDLDEMSVYSRALSQSEIQSIYNASSAGKCSSTSPAVPAISSFMPASDSRGATITISGTNFSAAAASNIVFFGAVRAIVSSASSTNLLVTVPSGATFAPITVTVGGLTASSTQPFEPTFNGNGSGIGSGSFAASFTLGSGSGPGSSIIADLDGDGKPDVAFVSGDAHTISIFRNIGTNATLSAASFAPRVDLPIPPTNSGDSPYRVRAVDVDGDGKLDLIACGVNGSKVSLFHTTLCPAASPPIPA